MKRYYKYIRYCTVSAILLGMTALLAVACSTAGTDPASVAGKAGRIIKQTVTVGQKTAGASSITAEWPKATTTFDKYVVEVASEGVVVWTGLVEKDKSTVDIPLPNGSYNVQVFLKKKADSNERQAYSVLSTATVSGTVATAPGKVSVNDVTFNDTSPKATLSWSAAPTFGKKADDGKPDTVSLTDGYTVYWAEGRSVDMTSAAVVKTPAEGADAYTADDLKHELDVKPGLTYSVIVVAKNTSGLSTKSDKKTFEVPAGSSAPGAPDPATALKVDASVDAEQNRLALQWTAPASLGTTDGTAPATLSEYILYWKKWKEGTTTFDTSAYGVQWASAGVATKYVVSGLELGVKYTFVVAAKNSAGLTAVSNLFSERAPYAPAGGTEPAKAVIADPTPTVNQVALTWSQSDLGTTDGTTAAKLVRYTLYWIKGDKLDDLSKASSVHITSNQHTLTGLTANTQYSVVVVTVSDGGTTGKSQSEAKTFTTAESGEDATPPGAPTNVEAISAGKTTVDSEVKAKVIVRWIAPSDLGKLDANTDAEITGYKVYWATTATVDTTSTSTSSKSVEKGASNNLSTSVTIDTLSGATKYYFVVVAKNNAGKESKASAGNDGKEIVTTDDLKEAPGKPGKPSMDGTATQNSIKVAWTAPSDTGKNADGTGATVTYTLYYVKGTELKDTTAADVQKKESAISPQTVDGLAAGSDYTFVVEATNSATLTSKSDSVTLNTASAAEAPGKPGKPSMDGTATQNSIKVAWTAPSDTGKNADGTVATVTYTLYYVKGTELKDTTAADVQKKESAISPQTVDGLAAGSDYTFVVEATNSATLTSKSDSVTLNTASAAEAPGKPGKPSMDGTATQNSIKVAWTAPSDTGKNADGTVATVTYTLYYVKGTELKDTTAADVQKKESAISPQTVDGLAAGSDYTFVVEATNSATLTSKSDSVTLNTASAAEAPGKPGKPSMDGTATQNSIKVAWTAPSDTGKNADGTVATVTYTLYYVKGTELKDTTAADVQKKESAISPQTVDGLAAGSDYTFVVEATNSATLTSKSDSVTLNTASAAEAPGKPGKPSMDGTATQNSIKVAWTAPSDTGKNADGTVATVTYTLYYVKGTELKDTTAADVQKKESAISPQTVDGLAANSDYAFVVEATNSATLTSKSDSVTLSTAK